MSTDPVAKRSVVLYSSMTLSFPASSQRFEKSGANRNQLSSNFNRDVLRLQMAQSFCRDLMLCTPRPDRQWRNLGCTTSKERLTYTFDCSTTDTYHVKRALTLCWYHGKSQRTFQPLHNRIWLAEGREACEQKSHASLPVIIAAANMEDPIKDLSTARPFSIWVSQLCNILQISTKMLLEIYLGSQIRINLTCSFCRFCGERRQGEMPLFLRYLPIHA